MSDEIIKKLTGKNPRDFEFAAAHIIDNADISAFEKLVEKSEFLFDFIKQNVNKRLCAAVNNNNYKNLLKFLNIYSLDYECFITSSLLKFADEELTDVMLEKLEHGSQAQKTYAAKYFQKINDTLAIDFLRQNAHCDFAPLAINCANALGAMNDEISYNEAVEKIHNGDDFEKLSAARFLIEYKNPKALEAIFTAMKTSPMPESIASEICYLQEFYSLLETGFKNDTLLALLNILHSLGEVIGLEQLFDFQLYEILDKFIHSQLQEKESKVAVFLLSAKLKFEQLTENDEYIFDEDKAIKEEVFAIRDLLNSADEKFWSLQENLIKSEVSTSSEFVFFALQLIQDMGLKQYMPELKDNLDSENQTLVLKTVEVIKTLQMLSQIKQENALKRISDENIKRIIQALFD